MLGKLLKYEFRATARNFVPLYGAVLVMAMINNLLFSTQSGIPAALASMVYFALLVAMFVVTIIVMIQRFYRNLLSDEGYLMFTLPVRTWQLISSKLIASVVWMLCGMFVTVLSIFVLAFNSEFVQLIPDVFRRIIEYIQMYLTYNEFLYITGSLLSGLIGLLSAILHLYAAIAIGHLFMKRRVLASFGAYMVLNIVEQTITSLIYKLIDFSFSSSFNSLDEVSGYAINQWGASLPFVILVSLLFCAGYFVITNFVLSRKLNLE